MPYLDVLADFRERVRGTALEQKGTPPPPTHTHNHFLYLDMCKGLLCAVMFLNIVDTTILTWAYWAIKCAV